MVASLQTLLLSLGLEFKAVVEAGGQLCGQRRLALDPTLVQTNPGVALESSRKDKFNSARAESHSKCRKVPQLPSVYPNRVIEKCTFGLLKHLLKTWCEHLPV